MRYLPLGLFAGTRRLKVEVDIPADTAMQHLRKVIERRNAFIDLDTSKSKIVIRLSREPHDIKLQGLDSFGFYGKLTAQGQTSVLKGSFRSSYYTEIFRTVSVLILAMFWFTFALICYGLWHSGANAHDRWSMLWVWILFTLWPPIIFSMYTKPTEERIDIITDIIDEALSAKRLH